MSGLHQLAMAWMRSPRAPKENPPPRIWRGAGRVRRLPPPDALFQKSWGSETGKEGTSLVHDIGLQTEVKQLTAALTATAAEKDAELNITTQMCCRVRASVILELRRPQPTPVRGMRGVGRGVQHCCSREHMGHPWVTLAKRISCDASWPRIMPGHAAAAKRKRQTMPPRSYSDGPPRHAMPSTCVSAVGCCLFRRKHKTAV